MNLHPWIMTMDPHGPWRLQIEKKRWCAPVSSRQIIQFEKLGAYLISQYITASGHWHPKSTSAAAASSGCLRRSSTPTITTTDKHVFHTHPHVKSQRLRFELGQPRLKQQQELVCLDTTRIINKIAFHPWFSCLSTIISTSTSAVIVFTRAWRWENVSRTCTTIFAAY